MANMMKFQCGAVINPGNEKPKILFGVCQDPDFPAFRRMIAKVREARGAVSVVDQCSPQHLPNLGDRREALQFPGPLNNQ